MAESSSRKQEKATTFDPNAKKGSQEHFHQRDASPVSSADSRRPVHHAHLWAVRRSNSFISLESWFVDYGKVSLRRRVHALLANTWVRGISCSMVLLNFVIIWIDTDMRAIGTQPPVWLEAVEAICFAFYVAEFLAVVFVERRATLKEHTNLVDLFVIILGAVDYIMVAGMGTDLDGFTIARLVRLLRLLRLIRALRILQHLPELRKLLIMFVASFRTIFWSFLLCFLIMTLWSTIAVELLNGILHDMVELQPEGWQDCSRCERAFASIMDANLTFLQTVVAGDTWGLIAIPVIEAHPWTAIIFVGALATLVYGVLNLVVAVIVDTFAELRSKDIGGIAEDMKREERQEKRRLQKLFFQIDKNKDGFVTLVELCDAARYVPSFRNYLRVMQVEGREIADFFALLDENGDSRVECQEFVDQMFRFRHDMAKVSFRARSQTSIALRNTTSNLDATIDGMEEKVMARMKELEKKVLSEVGTPNRRMVSDGASQDGFLPSQSDIIQQGLQDREIELASIIRDTLARSATGALEAAIDKAIHIAQRQMRESSHDKAEDMSRQLGWLRETSKADSSVSMRSSAPSHLRVRIPSQQSSDAAFGASMDSACVMGASASGSKGYRGWASGHSEGSRRAPWGSRQSSVSGPSREPGFFRGESQDAPKGQVAL